MLNFHYFSKTTHSQQNFILKLFLVSTCLQQFGFLKININAFFVYFMKKLGLADMLQIYKILTTKHTFLYHYIPFSLRLLRIYLPLIKLLLETVTCLFFNIHKSDIFQI